MALSKVGKNQVDQSASLTVDGDLTVDTNTLYVDSANNRVGIGISPSYALHTSTSSGVNRFESTAATGEAVIHTFNRDGQTAYIGKENSVGSYTFSSGGVADAFAIAHYGSAAPIQIGHNTPEVIIDSSGRVTMPYQPAFSFIGLDNSWANNSSYQTLIPDSTKINRGNHYNGNTGVFTAPISGVYFFGFWGLVYSNSGQVLNWRYSLNGGFGSQGVQASGSTGNHTNTSGSIILSLSANDTVTLDVGLNSQTAAVPWSNQWNMYGYLMF